MLNEVVTNGLRFLFLVLLQGLVLDRVELGGFVDPYLYVLFLLMLPFETPDWLGLILAFILGICVDVFSDTLGMHASASVTLAFIRPFVLRAMEPREGYETGMRPTIGRMGFGWIFSYAGLLILIHHVWLHFVEVFRFERFFMTLWRSLLSASLTLSLVLLVQFLMVRPARRR